MPQASKHDQLVKCITAVTNVHFANIGGHKQHEKYVPKPNEVPDIVLEKHTPGLFRVPAIGACLVSAGWARDGNAWKNELGRPHEHLLPEKRVYARQACRSNRNGLGREATTSAVLAVLVQQHDHYEAYINRAQVQRKQPKNKSLAKTLHVLCGLTHQKRPKTIASPETFCLEVNGGNAHPPS